MKIIDKDTNFIHFAEYRKIKKKELNIIIDIINENFTEEELNNINDPLYKYDINYKFLSLFPKMRAQFFDRAFKEKFIINYIKKESDIKNIDKLNNIEYIKFYRIKDDVFSFYIDDNECGKKISELFIKTTVHSRDFLYMIINKKFSINDTLLLWICYIYPFDLFISFNTDIMHHTFLIDIKMKNDPDESILLINNNNLCNNENLFIDNFLNSIKNNKDCTFDNFLVEFSYYNNCNNSLECSAIFKDNLFEVIVDNSFSFIDTINITRDEYFDEYFNDTFDKIVSVRKRNPSL